MNEVHRRILVKKASFSMKVSPHIELKVKWLKSKFHIVNVMLKESGCQWNDIEKKIACERQWYESYCLNHKEAKGLWDVQFPYFNQLELVYGGDGGTGALVEGYEDVIHNLEAKQNVESGGKKLGEFHFSCSDDEENDVQYIPPATQTTSNFTNATRMARKKKATFGGNTAVKKRKAQDMEAQLEGINHYFQTFVQGFNANFGTMANDVFNAMTDGNIHQKVASEKLKDVLVELVKINIPSGDVIQAVKINLFPNLPHRYCSR